MPIYEFECNQCGDRQEVICWFKDRPQSIDCDCGGVKRSIISAGDVYCGNEDTNWLKSVPDVIDRETTNPVAREFMRNPTRHNYKRWMKSEGIRPLENNEKASKPPPVDMRRINRQVWDNFQRKQRIEI